MPRETPTLHHPLLGEVDPVEGPRVLEESAIDPPPGATPVALEPDEVPPEFAFPAPDPLPLTPRERIEERIRGVRARVRTVAARELRRLAKRLEK